MPAPAPGSSLDSSSLDRPPTDDEEMENGASEGNRRRLKQTIKKSKASDADAALAAVATSPSSLAEALVRILETVDAAGELLWGTLEHLNLAPSATVAAATTKQGQSVRLPLKQQGIFRSSSSLDLVSAQPQQHNGSVTEYSAFAEEEDLSREQLQAIKARTMYNMVEELDDGKCKLLFLTNPQAELISSSSESVQRMLDALEVQKPSLVIELLSSGGFRGSTTVHRPEHYDTTNWAGMVHGRPPFLTDEDEQEAEAKIDIFMANVLIPLAAQTHAVVLCNACPGNCMLSTAFLRMFSLMKSKWSGPPPLTVISMTNNISHMYTNPIEDAHWKSVRRASRAWRQRDAKLLEVHGPKSDDYPQSYHDLDPNTSCLIMTDSIHPKRDKLDTKPFNVLRQALVRHLSSSVPSLAIKTGLSAKVPLGSDIMLALDLLSARAQAGTPVLALDVRNRLPLTLPPGTELKGQRAALIEEAKNQLANWRESLLEEKEGKPPLAETLDVCTLSYLRGVLKSDGGASTSARGSRNDKRSSIVAMPLHEAIRRAQDEENSAVEGDGSFLPATPAQIAELARWHANCIFSDAWKLRKDREEREKKGETWRDFYGDKINAQEVHARTLLSSPNFFHVNLGDMETAQKLVNEIVRLDRLPPINPLQGLLLLQDAWRDFDVAMLLAERYKQACKFIFALQLLVSWLVIVGAGAYAHEMSKGYNVHAVFGLAVAFSILVSFDGMLNPKSRWRQLRSSAMSLHSIIWRYRTRTGPFEVDESRNDSSRPEDMLCSVLSDWRDELLAGAGLKTSNLKRKYPSHVYRHHQDRGKVAKDADDHQSPTQPNRYIKLRVEPMMDFYALRVPKYTNHGFALKTTILILGVVSSVLARYKMLAYVMVVTAAATGVTSWSEFSEDSRKVERYSSAINALQNILSWWKSLSEVEKASRESISHLVLEAEVVISQEQRSWTSTANKPRSGAETTESPQERSGGDGTKALAAMV